MHDFQVETAVENSASYLGTCEKVLGCLFCRQKIYHSRIARILTYHGPLYQSTKTDNSAQAATPRPRIETKERQQHVHMDGSSKTMTGQYPDVIGTLFRPEHHRHRARASWYNEKGKQTHNPRIHSPLGGSCIKISFLSFVKNSPIDQHIPASGLR